MKNIKNTLRKKNAQPMQTVDLTQFVTEDWEYVLAEKHPTGPGRDAVGVNAKENGTESVTRKREDVPAATTKKPAGERDVSGR